MLVVVRRVAALLGLALMCTTLTSCTPRLRHVEVANETDHVVSVRVGPWRLGSVDAHSTSEIELEPGARCIDGTVRVVTEDGALATVLAPGRLCSEGVVRLDEDDLAPATASATVVNTTDALVDLSFLTGEDLSAAPGEEVRVALQVPAGQCLAIPQPPPRGTPAPPFWGAAVCDGEVKPFALPGEPSAVVDNRTDDDLTLLDGSTVLGSVAAGARVELPLPGVECLPDGAVALTADRRRIAPLGTVCPTDVLVVDELVAVASARLTNSTDVPVTVLVAGPALAATEVALAPGGSRRVLLDSTPGTCVLVTATTDVEESRTPAWSGYLCDLETVTLRPDPRSPGVGALWEASW